MSIIISFYNNHIKPRSSWLILVLAFFLILGAFGLGDYLARKRADEKLMELLAENQSLHTEIVETRNRYTTAAQAIEQLSDENTQLIELVAELQTQANKPPVIKEVVVTRTMVQPSEPVVIMEDLPDRHEFVLEPGLEVARFYRGEQGFVFQTHSLSIRNSVVIGEKRSAALLQIASSADPETYYDIPIDEFQVRIVDPERKLFRPDLMLAVRAGLSESPQLTASLALTLLHPTDCIDTLGINVSANSKTAQFGVIPFAYNLGCHIPVVNDLWVVTDAYVDIGAKFGAGVGIGTKF